MRKEDRNGTSSEGRMARIWMPAPNRADKHPCLDQQVSDGADTEAKEDLDQVVKDGDHDGSLLETVTMDTRVPLYAFFVN